MSPFIKKKVHFAFKLILSRKIKNILSAVPFLPNWLKIELTKYDYLRLELFLNYTSIMSASVIAKIHSIEKNIEKKISNSYCLKMIFCREIRALRYVFKCLTRTFHQRLNYIPERNSKCHLCLCPTIFVAI